MPAVVSTHAADRVKAAAPAAQAGSVKNEGSLEARLGSHLKEKDMLEQSDPTRATDSPRESQAGCK